MSVVIGDQRPGDRLPGLVVVPDGGGHGQDALGDPDGDALEGAPAVCFEVELAFEGVVDRLDQLADRSEQRLAVRAASSVREGRNKGMPPPARPASVWRPANPL